MPGLARNPIQWIIYGPFEKQLSPSFQVSETLKLVYNSQGLQIYQVK